MTNVTFSLYSDKNKNKFSNAAIIKATGNKFSRHKFITG